MVLKNQKIDTNKNIDMTISSKKRLYIAYEKIPLSLLPFKENKRKYLFDVRDLYLTISQLNEYQINKLKKFIKSRFELDTYSRKLNKNLKRKYSIIFKGDKDNTIEFNRPFNYYNLYSYQSYNLFLNKLANLLMKAGHKTKAFKILLKAFEILKLKLNLINPFIVLLILLFYNLVPIMHVKVTKTRNKKVLGIPISIAKRISITLKVFIKALVNHKMPIVYSFIYEYLSLIKGDSYLHSYNKKVLKDIEDNKLYKFLRLDTKNKKFKVSLTPEITSIQREDKEAYDLGNILKIDWKNFDRITKDLKIINLREICSFQKKVLFIFKVYIILKYTPIDSLNLFEIPVSDFLIDKYSLNTKHKVFTYKFLNSAYLRKRKKKLKDWDISENRFKLFFDKRKPHRLMAKRLLSEKELENRRFSYVNLLLNKIVARYKRKVYFEDKTYEVTLLRGGNFFYKRSDYVNKFTYYLINPDYFHLNVNKIMVAKYLKQNFLNFKFFPCFYSELKTRLNMSSNNYLNEEDFLNFFMGKNPNLINLNLKTEHFPDNKKIKKLFKHNDIWRASESNNNDVKNDEFNLFSNIHKYTMDELRKKDLLKKYSDNDKSEFVKMQFNEYKEYSSSNS